uniref:FRIGIDA-like protein n=1 Tax=Wollemia nobilis TaxID=56998 RepID=A0A0C9RJV0_9CONI
MEDLDSRKERLQKAFVDLDEHRAALTRCTVQWKELEEHFSSLEKGIQKKYEDLKDRESAFEAKAKETQEILDKREQSIAAKEQASLVRVQELRDAALAAISEERKKLKEEFTNGVEKKSTEEDNKKQSNKEKANGSAIPDFSTTDNGSEANNNKEVAVSPNAKSEAKAQVQVRSQLKTLCETMDSKGLVKYIVEHRKDAAGLRSEVPSALNSAIDPARLVLESLEGFYQSEQKSPGNQGDKKESGLPAQRRACILLLESLVTVLADPVLGVEHPVVPSNIKEKAKSIADEWKSKIDLEGDAANGNSLEAQAFLQLLATFGIASEFNQDDLCKLVLAVARRRQTPELCRSLGLTSKMPDFVETLVNSGKQIEAVNFAFAFELTEKFPPVPLLKEYLKDAKKASQASIKSGNNSTAAQNEANTKELSALRAVIKCIEEHKLESQYSPDSLQKRVAQLEKAKADRKRSAGAVKSQPKRPRANGGNVGAYAAPLSAPERTPAMYASSNAADRSFYRPVERVQYSGAGVASYNLQGQSPYDRSSQGIYSSAYGVGNRSPVSLSRSYMYPSDNMGPSLLGSGSYNSSTNYNHHFGSSMPPPPPAYQSSFIH